MIEKKDYRHCEHFSYVTVEQLRESHTKEEFIDFFKWFRGQTGGVVDGKCVVYIEDYERWLKSGKPTEQGIDWD
jgi:hypothetical protein